MDERKLHVAIGADRADRADRVDRVDRTDRAERAERTDRADPVDRGDRADRVDRVERTDWADPVDRPDRAGRADRAQGTAEVAQTTDYLVSGLSDDGHFRVLAARTTLLAEEGRRRHQASRTVTAALGRAMTCAAMMAATLDHNQSVTLRFLGDGPVGGVIAEGVHRGDHIGVRGYAGDPGVELPPRSPGKLDVGRAVGSKGFLYVTRDLDLKEVYTGSAELQSGEIGIDLAYYYTVSEQLPTAVSVGVRIEGANKGGPDGRVGWVTGAGGLMIQVMPRMDPKDSMEAIDRIQSNLDAIGPVSMQMQEGALPEALAEAVFRGVGPVTLLSRFPIRFECRCSRERAFRTLSTLGKEDLHRLAAEQDNTEVRCHFCNEAYGFSSSEIREYASTLLSQKAKDEGDPY